MKLPISLSLLAQLSQFLRFLVYQSRAIGWASRVFGIRFCLGIALAGILLLANWLPQFQPLALSVEGSQVASLSMVAPELVTSQRHYRSPKALSLNARLTPSYLEFDPIVSQRLNHSGMTQSVLTGSHLTRAHFFTSLPRDSVKQPSA